MSINIFIGKIKSNTEKGFSDPVSSGPVHCQPLFPYALMQQAILELSNIVPGMRRDIIIISNGNILIHPNGAGTSMTYVEISPLGNIEIYKKDETLFSGKIEGFKPQESSSAFTDFTQPCPSGETAFDFLKQALFELSEMGVEGRPNCEIMGNKFMIAYCGGKANFWIEIRNDGQIIIGKPG